TQHARGRAPVRLGARIRQDRGARRRAARSHSAIGRRRCGADAALGFAHVTQAWFEQNPAALVRLESQLRARYPTLHAFIVAGECRTRGTFAAVEADRYALDIALPLTSPHAMPSVWETGGRIPREIDRHVFVDGSLCLGAPLALWIQLGGDYSIE